VTISTGGGVLTVTDVHTNAGWTADVEEASGREVEVTFRNGLRRIDFKAELEDGRLETRVRDRAVEQDDTPAATTPTTSGVDDHGDDNGVIDDRRDGDDDHSGPGRDGDDDHSGSGSDDDHSGRG